MRTMSGSSNSTELASLHQILEALSLEMAFRDLSTPDPVRSLVPMLTQIGRSAESAGMNALPNSLCRLRTLLLSVPEIQARGAPAPMPLNYDPELLADFT
jgi:hypothetical protein